MIKEAIVKIVSKEDLNYSEAYTVMNEIMSGATTATQNAAFLAALSTKSARAETTEEIAGCAAAMRDHATRVDAGPDLFEIVGTGGDNAHSFNISTTAALVAAAGGMKVGKHGNRAASSLCGTADCLEALGVNIRQNPDRCRELLEEVGICFFFAQEYHASMKYVGAIRRELGFRTVFNILGPLTNPGSPSRQLLGVYDEYLVEPLARVLVNLGVRRGMVVYGQDRLDEYLRICDRLGLSALVETHDPDEVRTALAAGARVIGVNNRNLRDFTVDTDNSRRLRELVPPEVLFVSESGVRTAADTAAARAMGADAVLVGETLMRAADKTAKLAELRGGI